MWLYGLSATQRQNSIKLSGILGQTTWPESRPIGLGCQLTCPNPCMLLGKTQTVNTSAFSPLVSVASSPFTAPNS